MDITLTFNHIALSVKSVSESVHFYQSVFKLKEIPNTASTSKTRWLAFDDGRQIHLIPRPEQDIKTTKEVHFALSTSNYEELISHLESLNILYEDWIGEKGEIYVRNDGIRQIYFQDPNGYWIEVNDDI